MQFHKIHSLDSTHLFFQCPILSNHAVDDVDCYWPAFLYCNWHTLSILTKTCIVLLRITWEPGWVCWACDGRQQGTMKCKHRSGGWVHAQPHLSQTALTSLMKDDMLLFVGVPRVRLASGTGPQWPPFPPRRIWGTQLARGRSRRTARHAD